VLVVLTEAVYFRASVIRQGLFGADYLLLHARHIEFAREALFGPNQFLPGWYPRELLGAPFAANLQSFPWIPTRLLLLLLDPRFTYAVGIAIAAALAAVFTYLFCRRAGVSIAGAAAAGWTFACAGYFASRVTAGHLPLLEAYPALPLLLWLADRAVASDRTQFQTRDLGALALAAACIALAGHPQLPVYSIAAAGLYLVARGRGGRRVLAVSSLALGVALSLVALWPMILLIQRSTRVLPLGPTSNDIAMAYRRLPALFWPAVDGWPEAVLKTGEKVFQGYPNSAYFWDTTSYIGLLPLIALLVLLVRAFWKRQRPAAPFGYLTVLGTGALLLSLPLAQPLHHLIHGTFFRSPARLLYVSTFCACVALGCAVDVLMNSRLAAPMRIGILAVCLTGHGVDLSGFARRFVLPAEPERLPASFEQMLDHELNGARIAAEDPEDRRRYDDAGIFDSILLASPYRALTGLAGLPRDLNEQRLDASEFPIPALQAAGVGFVITSEERPDLEQVLSTEEETLYRVPNPFPRAAFFGRQQLDCLPTEAMLDAFLAHPRADRLLVPADAAAGQELTGDDTVAPQVGYFRASSDEIRLQVAAARPGFVAVLESYDPGWMATVDGGARPVVLANGFTMAVRVSAGEHDVILRYRTPGRRLGILLSLASALLLAGLLWIASKNRNPA
jgi:hypothetical protein